MIDRPLPIVGKEPLPNNRKLHSYVRLVTEQGISLSLHEAASSPGHYWLTTHNQCGDHWPARLTLDDVVALMHGCDLILAEHADDDPETTDDELERPEGVPHV